MKESIFGIIGSVGAVLSLAIQSIKGLKTIRNEKADKLLLKLCDQIAYYEGVYKIKIINVSPKATAYDLHVTVRIKNNHFNYVYKLPDFTSQGNIYSVNMDNEKEMCEILINIDAMKIDGSIEKNASSEIIELYKKGKLELRHFLVNKEMYLSVRYYAVNHATGKTVDFEKHDFYYKDIAPGKFGIGDDFVTRI